MPIEDGITLSPEEVAGFEENGFLRLERLTTDAELEWLRDIYDRLFRDRVGEQAGMYFDLAGPRGHKGDDMLPQILAPEQQVPELLGTLYRRNARRVVSQLLGVAVDELTDGGHMILKPARYGSETPWHQDEAYWDPTILPRSISAWLPLDEATVESGCMQFIPGSHRGDVAPHRHISDDPTVHGLVTDGVDPSRAVPCPLPAGGATFHHCRTLHYAGPNRSDHPRRAYIIVVNAPPVPLDVPASRPWQEEERRALGQVT